MSAADEKHADDSAMAGGGRHMNWPQTVPICEVRIGASSEQHFYHFKVIVESGQVERGITTFVPHIRWCVAENERLDRRDLAKLRGNVQRSMPFLCGAMEIRAVVEEQSNRTHLSLARGVVEGGTSREVGLVNASTGAEQYANDAGEPLARCDDESGGAKIVGGIHGSFVDKQVFDKAEIARADRPKKRAFTVEVGNTGIRAAGQEHSGGAYAAHTNSHKQSSATVLGGAGVNIGAMGEQGVDEGREVLIDCPVKRQKTIGITSVHDAGVGLEHALNGIEVAGLHGFMNRCASRGQSEKEQKQRGGKCIIHIGVV
jgi:hypothetical protein